MPAIRKPVSLAIVSWLCRLCSIIRQAASSLRLSTAFAGDWPVTIQHARSREHECAVQTPAVDVIAQVALLTLTDYLNDVAQTAIDFPPSA